MTDRWAIQLDLSKAEPFDVLAPPEKKKRGRPRKEADNYPTPYPLALAICQRIAAVYTASRMKAPRIILEPSAGDGAFVRAAKAVWPLAQVVAVELRFECEASLRAAGACEVHIGDIAKYAEAAAAADLVVGNPPYNAAEQHWAALWKHLRPGVEIAWLLRLGFLAAKRRQATIYQPGHLRGLGAIVPRPSFTGDGGTGGTEYGLFVWTKQGAPVPGSIWPAIIWEKEEKEKA